tara:strand:+ start:6257 stop:7612 length:1356 start_codon:yes stop_codon:yes gene_type:complete
MKVVVIDDDPTGSQTVHGCPLLLRWDEATLRAGLRHPSPLLFLLADTRSLAPADAADRNREIVRNLDGALGAEALQRRDVLLVSRGDSTLRGHGVLEPDTLQDAFGPFDATCHVPAFLEGGRTTVNGVHLLHGQPVHTTPFAQDRLFRFGTSDLALWLEEKSCGAIRADDVIRITGFDLDAACGGSNSGRSQLIARLRRLSDNAPVVVDAERQEQLSAFASAVAALKGEKRFLFRSAASLVKALADPGPQPLNAADLAALRLRDAKGQALPGLVMVGSYVPLADQQLERLLVEQACVGLELPVRRIARVLDGPTPDLLLDDLEQVWQQQMQRVLSQGKTPVLFTSRGELTLSSGREGRRLSQRLARLMGRLAASLAPELGYIISKGGITTQTLLADGLSLEAVQLEGQLLPGLSLVRPSAASLRALPILTFPGNLGDVGTLHQAWQRMQSG